GRELSNEAVSLCQVQKPLHITWIQSEGLLEIGNALIPMSFASRNSAEGHSYLAAVGQHFADTTERRFGSPVITQNPILIITQGQHGFGRSGLQFLRFFQSTFRCVAPSGSSLEGAFKIEMRVHTRNAGPSKCKLGVKLHCPLKKTSGFR